MSEDRKFGAFAGAASAALYWAKVTDDDIQARLRALRNDKRDLASRLTSLLGSGDWLRLLYPTVRDSLLGLASSMLQAAPAVNPAVGVTVERPDLTSDANVPGISWPPQPGQYDSTGRTQSPGELALLFMLFAYEEPRIFVQALTQSKRPTPAAKLQLFYAIQALVSVITGQSLSLEEWKRVWSRLISGEGTKAPRMLCGPTQDDTPRVLGEFATLRDGTYEVRGVCGIQRDDGLGGSLTIFATFTKKGSLTLVRSDRLLAQLPPSLVGVDANFLAGGNNNIQLSVAGKIGMRLFWVIHLTVYSP